MNSKKILLTALVVACIIGVALYALNMHSTKNTSTKIEKPTVGILLSDPMSAPRWNVEADYLRTMLEHDGFLVEVLDAHGDGAVQASQVNDLVARGAKGLIIVAANANSLGAALVNAHEKGVKIISYDRILRRGPVDRYVTIDMTESGRLEFGALAEASPGAKFIYLGGDPSDENSTLHHNGMLLAQGVRTHLNLPVMVDSFMSTLWDSNLAYDYMKKKITSKTDFSSVIAANDGLANAAIRAAKDTGKKLVFVGGSDGDLDACARVRRGEQTITIMKPIRDLANEAVSTLEMLMKGTAPPFSATTDNGYAAIKTILIAPVLIDKKNITPDASKCVPI